MTFFLFISFSLGNRYCETVYSLQRLMVDAYALGLNKLQIVSKLEDIAGKQPTITKCRDTFFFIFY